MNVVYFAWVRERIGERSEVFDGEAKTVSDVLDQLASKSPAHELALSDRAALRCALDQKLVDPDTPIADAAELAIFPPMTGG
ncbi:MAG: molybdopterin converting factor subunit 1 [Pseudomonadota bacterium]